MNLRRYAAPVAAMTLIVLASNILVQFPVNGSVGRLNLADVLTWGAFTYPFAFLVTDLTNRWYGSLVARRVVYAGFTVAVCASVIVPPLLFTLGLVEVPAVGHPRVRLAPASGAAFLAAQLLDVMVFSRLRQSRWWRAPAFASIAGSVLDTAIFFTVAFAPFFVLAGPNDPFALEGAPLLGVLQADAPRWVSWALGDFSVKLLIAVVALVPYRMLMGRVMPYRIGPSMGAVSR